jgi:hypothetical protein
LIPVAIVSVPEPDVLPPLVVCAAANGNSIKNIDRCTRNDLDMVTTLFISAIPITPHEENVAA